jgi:hypothetical protein
MRAKSIERILTGHPERSRRDVLFLSHSHKQILCSFEEIGLSFRAPVFGARNLLFQDFLYRNDCNKGVY